MMKETEAETIKNIPRGGGLFTLTLQYKENGEEVQPGNFMMLSVGQAPNILLRRPMAFYDVRKNKSKTEIDILYGVYGRGTHVLSEKKQGDPLPFLGPLGNSFQLPKKNEKVAILAGGIGIAPFLLYV